MWRLIARTTSEADGLLDVTSRDKPEGRFPTEFERTRFGLTNVVEMGPDEPPVLVVWGDSPQDFALAMTWERTYRFGIWIPDEWWRDEVTRAGVVQAISTMATGASTLGRSVVHTSLSMPLADIEMRIAGLTLESAEFGGEMFTVPNPRSEIIAPELVQFPRFYKSHDAISGKYADEWSTTVVRQTDSTIEFAMLPPAPMINVPGLERIQLGANWQVDLHITNHQIPSTTAVSDDSVLVQKSASFATRIRSSRGGLSYASHRTDFVFDSMSVEQKLTRPFIRVPSLLAWSQDQARGHSMRVVLSSAGAQADLLATMLGGRQHLAELFSSAIFPALRAFCVQGKSSRDSYPDEDGCVIRGEGYLTYDAICARSAMGPDEPAARDKIDDLLRSGIVHRGLVVRCVACTQVSFVPIEDVATTIRCQRCLAETPLSREGWRRPIREPKWFYDLHPIARQVIVANGHVPLMLSRHLRGGSRLGYDDTSEFELVDHDGNRLAETDLLALADRRVCIAEAKSSQSLGTGRVLRGAAEKRVIAASVFAADEIILATTAYQWESASIDAVRTAISRQRWRSGTPPSLRIITGLGGASIGDRPA